MYHESVLHVISGGIGTAVECFCRILIKPQTISTAPWRGVTCRSQSLLRSKTMIVPRNITRTRGASRSHLCRDCALCRTAFIVRPRRAELRGAFSMATTAKYKHQQHGANRSRRTCFCVVDASKMEAGVNPLQRVLEFCQLPCGACSATQSAFQYHDLELQSSRLDATASKQPVSRQS